MFRRIAAAEEGNVFPRNNSKTHEDVWGSLMARMDDSFSRSLQTDAAASSSLMAHRGRAVSSAPNPILTNNYFSVMAPPAMAFSGHFNSSTGPSHLNVRSPYPQQTLREWIRLNKIVGVGNVDERKKYFERCVRIINSLVQKIVVTAMKKDKTGMEMEVSVHPKLLTVDNIMVHQSVEEGEAAFFVRTETEQDSSLGNQNTKFGAMKAMGIVAYQVLMRGIGPSILTFLHSTVSGPEGTPCSLLRLDGHDATGIENSDGSDQIKRRRAPDKSQGRITTAMLNARVPYPLCRFTVDLLGGECSDGLLFRSDNSFQSFSDVLADLSQMMEKPDAFLHLSIRDQWRLAIGDKMHGREAEKKAIMDVASRITGTTANDVLFEALGVFKSQNKQEIVMVTGKSGSGKSRLVVEAMKSLEKQGWLRLSCKFDRIVHAEPLSIMAGALNDFFQCLASSKHQQICTQLQNSMQHEDIMILSNHVPLLLKYLDFSSPSTFDYEVGVEQMHQLFCQLLAVISSLGPPIVFFVDDLQWGDAASISLFLALTKANEPGLSSHSCNQKKSNILFIGSYRDNEADGNQELKQMLVQLKHGSVTHIAVDGFDINTLNAIVSESLCLPARRTKTLSEIILDKTGGIVIHLIEFIGRLVEEKILFHNLVKGWEWDCGVIESCPISDSVAELFTLKLKALPAHYLRGLQICSIFGIQIEQRIIDFVQDFEGLDSVDINGGLKAALDLGLVQETGSKHIYKFAHDIIAQATLDTILDEERPMLLQNLTTALIKNASAANQMDSVVFVVVDLINRIENDNVTDPERRELYASINDKAAKKALAVPDFSSAVKYSEAGLSFLHTGHWENQHDLSVGLYTSSVTALYSCTNSDQDLLNERIEAVLLNSRSVEEEFKTRCIRIQLLSFTSLQTAINESHMLLERLDEPIDSSNNDPMLVSSELVRVKKAFLEEEQHFSTSMTRMVDTKKINAMKVMSSLSAHYHMNRSIIGGLVCSRMVEMSIQFGYCEESVFGLSLFAFYLVSVLGDIDQGCSCARMALSLSLKSRHKVNVLSPAVYIAVYGLVLIWKEPIQATLQPLLEGCRLGFDYGDIDLAVGNLQTYVMRSYLSGKKIDQLAGEIEMLAQKCAEHGRLAYIETNLAPIYNILRDLAGLQPQALAPKNRFIDKEERKNLEFNKNDQISFEFRLIVGISRSFYLRDLNEAHRMSIMSKDVYNEKKTVFNHIILAFYAGLTSCHYVRKTQDPSCLATAEKSCQRIEQALTHSVWNFESKFLLLKAEYFYATGKTSNAAKFYDDSIISARNHKFIHEEALACELAGYFYEETGDETKADAMFKGARDAYTKWGAVKKAEDPLMRGNKEHDSQCQIQCTEF